MYAIRSYYARFKTQREQLPLHHCAYRIPIDLHCGVVHHFVSVVDQHRIDYPFALIPQAAISVCCIRQQSCLR